MIRLSGTERVFISKDLIGFADRLTEENTIAIRLDLLMLGFGYAIKNRLLPADQFAKHELVRAQSLGDRSLAYEIAANWYAGELGLLEEIDDGNALIDFICRLGITGVRALQKQWEFKGKSQIQWHIMQLGSNDLDNELVTVD